MIAKSSNVSHVKKLHSLQQDCVISVKCDHFAFISRKCSLINLLDGEISGCGGAGVSTSKIKHA